MRPLAVHYLAALLTCAAAACSSDVPAVRHIGDPERGRELAAQFGCYRCHAIDDVAAATGTVGPPLDRFAVRMYAGSRLNTPQHLIEFLVDPRAVDPRTPMPSVGLRAHEAADIAAFLYTLR